MLIGQVILGGITRLTGSGLSITRWDIITGVIPPLNPEQWMEEFTLYQQTPQFQKINSTFTLAQFKFIYFWEYLHRLWVRSLGMIFLIPCIFFVWRKMIDRYLLKRLLIVVLLTMVTASVGWIMVQSGLVDRPWVDAYKLTAHFMLAVAVIAAMAKIVTDVYEIPKNDISTSRTLLKFTLGLTVFQLFVSGLMAGMRAGLYYPSWPDMNGRFIPRLLLEKRSWAWEHLEQYDAIPFAPTLVQFTHRMVAYLLVVIMAWLFFKYRRQLYGKAKFFLNSTMALVLIQLTLGILTVLNVNGKIPLVWGVMHQLFGLLFFLGLLTLLFLTGKKRVEV
jgi:cytochrome c oxidase assembly protein subunit 15